jgi:hypothetical protein
VSDNRTPTDLTRIRPAWWIVLPICAFFLFASILVVALLTLQAARATAAQTAIPGGWSWRGIILTDVAVLGATLWVCWGIIKQPMTRFTPEGITQPRLLGSVHIPWPNVEWVSPGLTVGSATERIAVSPHAFRNPEMMIQAIMDRVPEQTRLVK